MRPEAIGPFGRAPGATDQATHVISEHGAGVVEAKERIKTDPLELPLTYDTSPSTLERLVRAAREELSDVTRVMRVLIRLDLRRLGDQGKDSLE